MRQIRLVFSWLALCTLVLGGCASTGPANPRSALPPIRADSVGRLLIDGPYAFINSQRVMQNGSYVFQGETVSTGPGTSVLLVLNDGGEIQLDQNTDPVFWEAVCLVMEIARGRAAVKNQKCLDLRSKTPDAAGLLNSFVHIETSPDEARVTVLEGRVEMQRPSPATLGANEEYVARRDGGVSILQLTPEQAFARVAWTQNYFRQLTAQKSDGLSTGQVAVIGGVIAWIVKLIFDRNKDTPVEREPRPPVPAQTQPRAPTPPPQTSAPQTESQGRPALQRDIQPNIVPLDPRRFERNEQQPPPVR